MTLLETLRDLSALDDRLLERNRRAGDDLLVPRWVEFELFTSSLTAATRAHEFLEAGGYGDVILGDDPSWSLSGDEGAGWRVILRATIPTTPTSLKCISGFLLLIADQFGLRYCGWGCELKTSN